MRFFFIFLLICIFNSSAYSGVGDTYTCINQSAFKIPTGQKEFAKENDGGSKFELKHDKDYLIFINKNNTVELRIYEYFVEENIIYAAPNTGSKTTFPYDGFIVFKDGLLLSFNSIGFQPKQYGTSIFKNYARVKTAVCGQ